VELTRPSSFRWTPAARPVLRSRHPSRPTSLDRAMPKIFCWVATWVCPCQQVRVSASGTSIGRSRGTSRPVPAVNCRSQVAPSRPSVDCAPPVECNAQARRSSSLTYPRPEAHPRTSWPWAAAPARWRPTPAQEFRGMWCVLRSTLPSPPHGGVFAERRNKAARLRSRAWPREPDSARGDVCQQRLNTDPLSPLEF